MKHKAEYYMLQIHWNYLFFNTEVIVAYNLSFYVFDVLNISNLMILKQALQIPWKYLILLLGLILFS